MEIRELEIVLKSLVKNSSPSSLLCAVHNIFCFGIVFENSYNTPEYWSKKDAARFKKLMISLEKNIELAKKIEKHNS